jgi:hypothetical protein
MLGVLLDVRKELSRLGIPGVCLIIPYVIDVCPRAEYWVDPERYPAYRPENLRDAALQACGRAELEACDLFDAFCREDCRELFLRGWDDHWSSIGQALGARVLASHLHQRGFLTGNVK